MKCLKLWTLNHRFISVSEQYTGESLFTAYMGLVLMNTGCLLPSMWLHKWSSDYGSFFSHVYNFFMHLNYLLLLFRWNNFKISSYCLDSRRDQKGLYGWMNEWNLYCCMQHSSCCELGWGDFGWISFFIFFLCLNISFLLSSYIMLWTTEGYSLKMLGM